MFSTELDSNEPHSFCLENICYIDFKYRKILIIHPGLIVVQSIFLVGLYFWGSLFSEGIIIDGNFAFQNGLDLAIKQLKT